MSTKRGRRAGHWQKRGRKVADIVENQIVLCGEPELQVEIALLLERAHRTANPPEMPTRPMLTAAWHARLAHAVAMVAADVAEAEAERKREAEAEAAAAATAAAENDGYEKLVQLLPLGEREAMRSRMLRWRYSTDRVSRHFPGPDRSASEAIRARGERAERRASTRRYLETACREAEKEQQQFAEAAAAEAAAEAVRFAWQAPAGADYVQWASWDGLPNPLNLPIFGLAGVADRPASAGTDGILWLFRDRLFLLPPHYGVEATKEKHLLRVKLLAYEEDHELTQLRSAVNNYEAAANFGGGRERSEVILDASRSRHLPEVVILKS